jgi:Universal stress protein family
LRPPAEGAELLGEDGFAAAIEEDDGELRFGTIAVGYDGSRESRVALRTEERVRRNLDRVLIGSRGHYGVARRLLLGSVAARVLRSAPCPTLITPAV